MFVRTYTKCWSFKNISCLENVSKVFLKVLVFVLKISKDIWFENEQANRKNIPTQKSLFISSFLWYCYLTIDLVRSLIFGCRGTGVGHRIAMIAILWNILAILFEGLRSFWKDNFDSVIEALWSYIFWLIFLRYPTCITWSFL